jgi:hypothetical protein
VARSRWTVNQAAQGGTPTAGAPARYLMAIMDGEDWEASFALRQNRSRKHKKNYLLPCPYLVKENLTGCGGWFDRIQHVLHPVFLLFFHPRKGYKLPAFAREVLWLSEQRNGVRGLQVKSVT